MVKTAAGLSSNARAGQRPSDCGGGPALRLVTVRSPAAPAIARPPDPGEPTVTARPRARARLAAGPRLAPAAARRAARRGGGPRSGRAARPCTATQAGPSLRAPDY